MNRRLFLASLLAPFAARFAPKPAFIESRAFNIEEIARIFDVPPEMLGGEFISLSGAINQLCDAAGFTWSMTPDKMMRFEPKAVGSNALRVDGLPDRPEHDQVS